MGLVHRGCEWGVDLIFINISRVAHAQRTASLPTNPRGPHVKQIEEARKETERREKVREDLGVGEARGVGGRKACARVHACTASNECVHRIRAFGGERGERPRVREENAPKDPRRTKWSPLILRRHCKVHLSPEFSLSFPLAISFSLHPSRISSPFAISLSLVLFFSLPLYFLSLSRRSRYSLMRMQNRRSFSG